MVNDAQYMETYLGVFIEKQVILNLIKHLEEKNMLNKIKYEGENLSEYKNLSDDNFDMSDVYGITSIFNDYLMEKSHINLTFQVDWREEDDYVIMVGTLLNSYCENQPSTLFSEVSNIRNFNYEKYEKEFEKFSEKFGFELPHKNLGIISMVRFT